MRSPLHAHRHVSATHSTWEETGGPKAFTPPSIANNILWLRADSGNVQLDGSNNVSQWTDQSGHGNNFTQSTAGNRPGYLSTDAAYNNRPTTQYNGSTSLLVGPAWNITQPITMYLVGHATVNVAAEAFFEGVGSRLILRQENTIAWGYFAGSLITSGSNDGNPHVFCVVYDHAGGTSALYIDHWNTPTSTGDPGAGGNDTLLLGGSSGLADPLAGKIAEVAGYAAAHGGAGGLSTRQQVMQYLGTRYNIAVSA